MTNKEGGGGVGGGYGPLSRLYLESFRSGVGVPPQEECAYLTDFSPNRAHLLLKGVYRYYPHHHDRFHLDRGVLGDAVWHNC